MRYILISLASLMLIIAFVDDPASAQTPPLDDQLCTWIHQIDFAPNQWNSGGTFSGGNPLSIHTPGVGWEDNSYENGGIDYRTIGIRFSTDAGLGRTHIDRITVYVDQLDIAPSNPSAFYQLDAEYGSSSQLSATSSLPAGTPPSNFVLDNITTNNGGFPTRAIELAINIDTFSPLDGTGVISRIDIEGYGYNALYRTDYYGGCTLNPDGFTCSNGGFRIPGYVDTSGGYCSDDLVKPVASVNEAQPPFEVNDGFLDDETALNYSQLEGQPVHAAADGIVTVINDLRPDLADDPGEYCDFNINSTAPHCDVDIPATLGEHSWRLGEFEVIIDTDVGLFTYLVDNAPAYVDVGTPVTAGCVIGETIRLTDWIGLTLTQGGAAVNWFDNGIGQDPGPLVPLLTLEPNTIDACRPAPDVVYVHPIAERDRLTLPDTGDDFFSVISSTEEQRNHTVGAYSVDMGAPVHAAAAGVVESVRAIGNDIDGIKPQFVLQYGTVDAREWCDVFVGNRNGRNVNFDFDLTAPLLEGAVWDCVTDVTEYDDNPVRDSVVPGVFRGDSADNPSSLTVGVGSDGVGVGITVDLGINSPVLYVVTLALDDGAKMTYLVANALEFVELGADVTAGCIIGQTYGLDYYLEAEVNLLGLTQDYEAPYGGAIAFKTVDGNKESVEDQFIINPELPTRCNTPDEYERCIGDYTMSNASAWDVDSPWFASNAGADFSGSGVLLRPETRISAVYNLDPTREPKIVFYARATSGPGRLQVSLGTTVQNFDIATGDFQEYTLPAAAHVADLDPFFTYSYRNLADQTGGNIEISSACLSFTKDDDGNETPGGDGQLENSCAFSDNSFNSHDVAGWSLSSGVEHTEGGSINVPDGETFGQNISVPSGDYTLTIVTELWTTPGYVPDYTDVTSTIGITYGLTTTGGGVSGGEFEPLATFNGALGQYTYEIPINLTSPMEDGAFDMTVQLQLAAPNPDILGLKITFVCFSGEPLVFGVDCGAGTPRPDSPTQIGAWINYLWNQQNIFFRCELMILLNDMYQTMQEFFTTIGYTIRWGFASTDQLWTWSARVFFPWLDGHFRNISEGRQTFIEVNEGGEQCNNLFCVITGLFGSVDSIIGNFTGAIETVLTEVFGPLIEGLIGILNLVVGLTFDLGGGLIDAFLFVADRLFSLFDRGLELLGSLVDAWNNSEPKPIDGAPDCSNPQSSPLCAGIWMMENTIFSGPGAAVIPIITAYFAIMMLIWTMETLRKTVIDAGRGI